MLNGPSVSVWQYERSGQRPVWVPRSTTVRGAFPLGGVAVSWSDGSEIGRRTEAATSEHKKKKTTSTSEDVRTVSTPWPDDSANWDVYHDSKVP